MKLHANAKLGPKGRAVMVRRVVEEGWSLTEAVEAGPKFVPVTGRARVDDGQPPACVQEVPISHSASPSGGRLERSGSARAAFVRVRDNVQDPEHLAYR